MFTPFEISAQLSDNLCSYLETAYKVSDPEIYAERSRLLRHGDANAAPVVAQEPFVESTPRYRATRMFADVLRDFPAVPSDLVQLAGFGTTAATLPLYDHQAEAIQAALQGSNLVVATGTGSGKTEIFLLTILSEILKHASRWTAPIGPSRPGSYNDVQQTWLNCRINETRPPAMRAIILYPMNALVNDQLQRLRRVLATADSEAWQRLNLNNNRIYFGMYTGDSEPTGHWSSRTKRDRWANYHARIVNTWNALRPEYQRRGYWARPDSSEMLCRWDMQQAPPDILITNYSMLEYMLVRPIEAGLFDATARWLQTHRNEAFTLVIDEAHTYTGARGAEIGYLVRRLKERLGLPPGSRQFRCIATSASLPATGTAAEDVSTFAADLFGEGASTFRIIMPTPSDPIVHVASRQESEVFATFFEDISAHGHDAAIENMLRHVRYDRQPNQSLNVALYQALEQDPLLSAVRSATARNATQLHELCARVFAPEVTDETLKRNALAGVFAAGALARESEEVDAATLLSSRIHLMFRGLPGLWACMDPQCSEAGSTTPRVVGKLYAEPRPWCPCGARVLELFSCHDCGLLYLGGIPDIQGGLWPWSSNLEDVRQDLNDYVIFGVQRPARTAVPTYRSTRTSFPVTQGTQHAREVFEVQPATTMGRVIPFPGRCPRCNSARGRGLDGREIIEPFRTKGTKSFSALIEESYRTQPPVESSPTVNKGRKAITFADSRQDAAMLASDLELDHNRDVMRQIFYRLLISCPTCEGLGYESLGPQLELADHLAPLPCETCQGSGLSNGNISVQELRERTLRFADRARVNPTGDAIANYFGDLTEFHNPNESKALLHINVALEREVSATEIGLEPIGLASWHATVPLEYVQPFDTLSQDESRELIDSVVRLLATEHFILPPSRDHRYWSSQLYGFPSLLTPPSPTARVANNRVPFSLTRRRKLARYFESLAAKLIRDGRLLNQLDANRWIATIEPQLFNQMRQLRLLVSDANGNGFGLNIDRFNLVLMPAQAHVCTECHYVSNTALLHVCQRCGQDTVVTPTADRNNYYRRTVELVTQPRFPDPFMLRVFEHTAQIEKADARQAELRFQDHFVNNEVPDDARIDILSVTTTMEMGIDIGSLLTVGLRNVPPTVANYQQRAGRAGRRGVGVATVVSFAQPRSHDQYYFAQPPRIVSDPPRIPVIHIDNPVIARRHVRALVLQQFFRHWAPTATGQNVHGLLSAWGTIRDFTRNNGRQDLDAFVTGNRVALMQRAQQIVSQGLQTELRTWIESVPTDVARELAGRPLDDDVLGALLDRGFLPRHAFPIDVVSLYTAPRPVGSDERERGVQRDLGIALSEFAPGAEIVRDKYVYAIAGLYDPYNMNPQYVPNQLFVECRDCRAVDTIDAAAQRPVQCSLCGRSRLLIVPLLRPPGFCSDWTLNGALRRYLGGGRERVGSVTPAQLTVGEYSYGSPNAVRFDFAPALAVLVGERTLTVVNKGQDPTNPGFPICPTCGRDVQDNTVDHAYPADIPPVFGNNRGPRAGARCPRSRQAISNVTLGYHFPTEILQLGVDLPGNMEADPVTPYGRAVWQSFGTVFRNAAARYLQLGPEELRIGVRAVPRNQNVLHGECFIYDSLPGGAGHARQIFNNIREILEQALVDSQNCPNPTCQGACYSCVLSYDNQPVHAILDRHLAAELLEFVLHGHHPMLTDEDSARYADMLLDYMPDNWTSARDVAIGACTVPLVLRDGAGLPRAVVPRATLAARPDSAQRQAFLLDGYRLVSLTAFDLERRPYWAMQDVASQ